MATRKKAAKKRAGRRTGKQPAAGAKGKAARKAAPKARTAAKRRVATPKPKPPARGSGRSHPFVIPIPRDGQPPNVQVSAGTWVVWDSKALVIRALGFPPGFPLAGQPDWFEVASKGESNRFQIPPDTPARRYRYQFLESRPPAGWKPRPGRAGDPVIDVTGRPPVQRRRSK